MIQLPTICSDLVKPHLASYVQTFDLRECFIFQSIEGALPLVEVYENTRYLEEGSAAPLVYQALIDGGIVHYHRRDSDGRFVRPQTLHCEG